MGHTSSTIYPPVTLVDLQTILETDETNVEVICQDTDIYINKWARYKPERAQGPWMLQHGQYLDTIRSRKANGFGLKVPWCAQSAAMGWPPDVLNHYVHDLMTGRQGVSAWDYERPRGDRTPQGGPQEYGRITDFGRIPTDTTDPYYGTQYARGYNHRARIPFQVWIEMSGVTERTDGVLEINLQQSTNLVVNFFNSVGDDLHLQDFIDLDVPYQNNIGWRPILQIWRDWYAAGGEPWYERDQPDYQAQGGIITADVGSSWSVVFDLSGFTVDPNDVYHCCIGVGCVNPSWIWKDNNESLFLLPYDDAQLAGGNPPFYFKFAVGSHFDRDLKFVTMLYGTSDTADFDGSSVEIPASSSGTVVFQMTVKKNPDQALHFIGEHGTPATGYDSLKIALEDAVTGTLYHLSPTTGLNRVNNTQAYVPTGQETERVTLYGMTTEIDVNSIPNGGYGRYQVKAYIGATDPENANAISIHKLSQ